MIRRLNHIIRTGHDDGRMSEGGEAIGVGLLLGVVAAAATGLHRGPLTLSPAARAGYAALHIPRPCAFHAQNNLRRTRQEPDLRDRSDGSDGVSLSRRPDASSCVGTLSVPGVSQQWQTLNVRAANARALADAARVPPGRPLHCLLVRTFRETLL